MKFGRLLDIARNLSAEVLATGHYVAMENYATENAIDYGLCLKSGEDKSKDQSYFLALTPIERLRLAIFPLAHVIKKDIYSEFLHKNIVVPINKESQEVCFIPHDNYREFIELESQKYKIPYRGSGEIVYRDKESGIFIEKKLGMHNGLWRYTEGQRKGLCIAWSEPLYVIEKDENSNILYVGNQNSLNILKASASQINFLVPPQLWSTKLFVRTRFREQAIPATIFISLQNEKSEIELGNLSSKHALDELQNQCMPYLRTEDELQNQYTPDKLFHVRDEDNRFNCEQDQIFSDQRAIWNTAPLVLTVHFENYKQVYAKGQVLAVYDENGFVLAGAILH